MSPPLQHSAERIRWLFAQKELACASYVRGVAQTLEMSENELRVLLCIARHGEITPGLLGLRSALSAPAIGAIVGRLVDAGMVERHPHRRDGRSSTLRLTEQSEAALQARFASLAARIDGVFEALPEHDRGVVERFLGRVADASAEAAEGVGADAAAVVPGRAGGAAAAGGGRGIAAAL